MGSNPVAPIQFKPSLREGLTVVNCALTNYLSSVTDYCRFNILSVIDNNLFGDKQI